MLRGHALSDVGGKVLKSAVQVKLEGADRLRREIMTLCLVQCQSPDDRNLLRIGSQLGDFTNNLRSALNYAMRYVVQTRLAPLLSPDESKRLERRQDFPYAETKERFDKVRIVPHIRNHLALVYGLLEKVQPYHEGNEWLGHLMTISNVDKHVVIVQTEDQTARAVCFLWSDGTPYPAPSFFGPGLDRILVKSRPEPHVHLCPCYYAPFGGFAAKGGRWVFFLVSFDDTRLGLTRFIEQVPVHVRKLIDGLWTLV